MGILSGASASSLCTWRVLLPSVKEGPVYSSEQPGSDNNLLVSLLHAVVFKCQIAIRAECSDQVRSLVTVWLALLSPCARWMRNTHLCFPRYFLCVFKNFLKWAWYLCFSIWRHGHVVGFFSCIYWYIYIYSFVTKPCLIYVQSLYVYASWSQLSDFLWLHLPFDLALIITPVNVAEFLGHANCKIENILMRE